MCQTSVFVIFISNPGQICVLFRKTCLEYCRCRLPGVADERGKRSEGQIVTDPSIFPPLFFLPPAPSLRRQEGKFSLSPNGADAKPWLENTVTSAIHNFDNCPMRPRSCTLSVVAHTHPHAVCSSASPQLPCAHVPNKAAAREVD